MTVKELKQKLEEFDENLPIEIEVIGFRSATASDGFDVFETCGNTVLIQGVY